MSLRLASLLSAAALWTSLAVAPGMAEAKPRAVASSSPPSKGAAAKGERGSSDAGSGASPASSRSVGSPTQGHLEGGARLDERPGQLRLVPGAEHPHRRWGTVELVRMLERGARVVSKRYPGSVLGVGDLSKASGGDLEGHQSHESGRDADVAFYAVDRRGRPSEAPDFLHFDTKLEARGPSGLRFDVARNWELLAALLQDPRARVTHVFLAEHLRAALLKRAKVSAPSALYTRAAQTLMQPSDGFAHDDHMHVRIACPPASKGACIEVPEEAPLGAHAKAQKAAPKAKARVSGVRKSSRMTVASTNSAGASRRPVAPPAQPGSAVLARKASLGPSKALPVVPAKAALPVRRSAPELPPPLLRVAPAGADADADAFEVKDLLDEVGAIRITD